MVLIPTMANETYHVLECSRIETPAEFWALYVDQVDPEGVGYFGRNLDAFWDALSAAGPGWPGECILEVRNVEALEANGHGKFVAELEKIATELKEAGSGVELMVMRLPVAPRGRLYQHDQFVSRELEGCIVERAVAWQTAPNTCDLLWVKPEGRPWQRFFLDAGFTGWEEWSEEQTFEDFEDIEDELVEVGDTLGLCGKVIATAEATSDDSGWGFILRFADGSAIRMWPDDPRDFDSDTRFAFSPAKTQ